MDDDGGGWTVLQRRGDNGRPRNFFLKRWRSYKAGFGDPAEDFWIGLDTMHLLTSKSGENTSK